MVFLRIIKKPFDLSELYDATGIRIYSSINIILHYICQSMYITKEINSLLRKQYILLYTLCGVSYVLCRNNLDIINLLNYRQ